MITNHDIVVSYNAMGDGIHNDDIAKMMAALYLTLRGSAIINGYGEEIGMENNDPKSKDDVQDPIGKLGWPLEKGRDGERTPMQWNGSVNAGFSVAKPWLPMPGRRAMTHNVADEMKDPDSVLSFYRKLLALRRTEAALLDGDYVSVNEDNPSVLTYLRRTKGEAVLVILNMSAVEQRVLFDLSPTAGCGSRSWRFCQQDFLRSGEGDVYVVLPMEPHSDFIARDYGNRAAGFLPPRTRRAEMTERRRDAMAERDC